MLNINIVCIILSMSICMSSYADSTLTSSSPPISMRVISSGAPCTYRGETATTSSSSFASCENGKWQTRDVSNPVLVNSVSPRTSGPYFRGAYAACPSGKKIITVGCWVWEQTTSSIYYIDESGPASGLSGNDPIEGDQGAYCAYYFNSGAVGTLVPTGVCGDR